jgi:hypothetical protein
MKWRKVFNNFFFISLLNTSCNSNSPVKLKGDQLNTKTDLSNNISQVIIWPDSLLVYNPDSLQIDSNSRVLTNSKFKVYTYLNLTCSSCLSELNEWSKIAAVFKQKNVELIMICYAKDNFEFFKYLYESKKIKSLVFPFYLESNFAFSKLNSRFKKHELNQIALTDGADNILLFGDIIHSKEIYNSFLKIIDK